MRVGETTSTTTSTTSKASTGGCSDKGCKGGGSCSANKSILNPGYILGQIWSFILRNTKYAFYALVIVLYPSSFYRFFFKFGDYSLLTLVKMTISAFFAGMAYWSHHEAGPPKNPGWLEWEHFRTDEQLKDKSNKLKW